MDIVVVVIFVEKVVDVEDEEFALKMPSFVGQAF